MTNEAQLARLLKSSVEHNNCAKWNQWRKENPQVAIDLSGANLSRAVFINPDDFSLAGVNLSRANLTNANLRGTDLTGANLSHADLSEANLSEANLSGARLNGCLLTAINLMGAILTRASFRNATIDKGTILHNSHLTQLEWRDAPYLVTDALLQHKKTIATYRSSAQSYRELANELRSHGYIILASGYRLRAERIERRGMRAQFHLLSWFGSLLLDIVSGYGERARNTFMAYIFVVGMFSLLFFIVTNTVEVHSTSVAHLSWDESLVLSLTSFHGRGFFPGYLQLDDWVARLGAIEAVVGLFIELTLIATFSRRFLGN